MKAGDLRHRLRFQQRETVSDGYGNVRGEWVEQFTRWAAMKLRPGSEAVMAAQLEGRQPVEVTVREDPETRTIRNDWRVIDEHGLAYAVRSPATPDPLRPGWIVFMMESGVAA